MQFRNRLRTPEAARYLGLAPATLEKLRLTKDGPPFIRVGRAVIYDPRDLDTWLEAQSGQERRGRGE